MMVDISVLQNMTPLPLPFAPPAGGPAETVDSLAAAALASSSGSEDNGSRHGSSDAGGGGATRTRPAPSPPEGEPGDERDKKRQRR